MAGMHSAAFSLDGQRLMTGTSGNEAVILWDMNTYERLLTLPAASSVINAVAFSPDGNFIVGRSAAGATAGMGRANDALYVWRAPSWTEIEAKEAQKAR